MEKKYIVYLIKYQGVIEYAGETGNYNKRKLQHLNYRGTNNSGIPVDVDLNQIEFVIVDGFDNEDDALKLEGELIIKYNLIECGWNKNRSGLISKQDDYDKCYKQQYYQKHKDEYKKRNDEYYKTDEYRELEKARRQTTKRKKYMQEYRKAYRKLHAEELKIKNHEYYMEHKNVNVS